MYVCIDVGDLHWVFNERKSERPRVNFARLLPTFLPRIIKNHRQYESTEPWHFAPLKMRRLSDTIGTVNALAWRLLISY
jgi:hypothetical protein